VFKVGSALYYSMAELGEGRGVEYEIRIIYAAWGQQVTAATNASSENVMNNISRCMEYKRELTFCSD